MALPLASSRRRSELNLVTTFGLDFCVVVSTKVDFVGGSTSPFIDSLLSISALDLDLVFTGVFSLE